MIYFAGEKRQLWEDIMAKNVIVGQSGGPTAVINSSLVGVYEAAVSRGAQHVYGMQYGVQGLLEGKYIDLGEHLKSSLEIELLKRTPSSFLGSCRYKLPAPEKGNAVYEKLFAMLAQLDVGFFFYIGGNDSMDTIYKLSTYAQLVQSDIKFMGIPKTIDNDLALTDHTPGYGSAAKYIATLMKEIVRDSLVYDLKNVTIVEIMGRNAGWLTGAAALAKDEDCEGVDLICLPEVPFDIEKFVAEVDRLMNEKGGVVVALSEGVRLADGRCVCELEADGGTPDAFGHKIMAGAARYLSNLVASRLHCKSRSIELSTLQRCGSHICSRVDVTEAYQAGGAAVYAAFSGHTGEMVGLQRHHNNPYQCYTAMHPIGQIANVEKTVPTQWITPNHMQVTNAFCEYARPLIQAELTPIYINGLPRHLYL